MEARFQMGADRQSTIRYTNRKTLGSSKCVKDNKTRLYDRDCGCWLLDCVVKEDLSEVVTFELQPACYKGIGQAKRKVRVLQAKETTKHKGPKVGTNLMWSRKRKSRYDQREGEVMNDEVRGIGQGRFHTGPCWMFAYINGGFKVRSDKKGFIRFRF